MIRSWKWILAPLALSILGAGVTSWEGPRAWPGEELAGGETTVFDAKHSAFGRALQNLDRSRWLPLRSGKRLFENPWIPLGEGEPTAPRQGLGPLYNATACTDCHFRDGRGGPPETQIPTGQSPALAPPPIIARLGRSDSGPDPLYGYQLNDRGLGIPAEGQLRIENSERTQPWPNGEDRRIQRPRAVLANLSLGPLDPESRISLRIPPTLVGLGLLEAVPDAQLEALADPEDRNSDGISGKVQRLSFPTGSRVGRFGWKAGQPDLESQAARAFHEDLGVTSSHFPHPNCPPEDKTCRRLMRDTQSRSLELTDTQLGRVALYLRLLAPPARRDWQNPEVLAGREVFLSLGCGSCHRPELKTGSADPPNSTLPELANQKIRPFTDLLLHDMGPLLADGVAEHQASPSEWRTAPLWGLGLLQEVNGHLRFLHDGRARSMEEAILWHGGEAQPAREAFIQLPGRERKALLRFLHSL